MRPTIRFASALALLCWLLLPAAAAPPGVKSVVVNFDDGSQQRLDGATPTTTPAPATAPATQPFAPPGAFLGVNLEGLRDYDRAFMFIDAIKTSRRFGSAQRPFDQKAICDADGNPGEDAGTLVITEAKDINGVYHFSATGRCILDTPNSPAKVQNLSYDPNRNRTTADVVVLAPARKLVTLTLVFKNVNGVLRDIKLLRPGYADDAKIFTAEFLDSLKPFSAIRFMDYLRTNNTTIAHWSERAKPTDAQFTNRGGPYEYAIELGNQSGKDIWINVPALADDDFVRQLGDLVRARLRSDLHCYVEYSNEVWNGQFKQFAQNMEAARAQVAAGDTTLNDNGRDANPFYWGRKRIAKRSIEIQKLLGDPGAPGRFRMILASQVGYAPPGALLKMQLDYVVKYFGPPANYFYAVACAPYFSAGKDPADPTGKKWFTERADLTADALAQRLLARYDSSRTAYCKAFHALAKQYGLKSFAYEGGVDLQQYTNNLDEKIASQYDPRTGQAVEQYLTSWYDGGGDALFYFNLSGRYGKGGYWGLTEDVRQLDSPKYRAAERVAARLKHQ